MPLVDFLNSPAGMLFGSPASWAEIIGALLGLAMVVCNIFEIHWGWPLAFASSVLYVLVFGVAKLYGESALQVFFAATAIWGWTQWLRGALADGTVLHISRLNKQYAIKIVAACAILWLIIGLFSLKFTDSDVPWLDAFPTALSLVGTWLLGRKYIENWPMWIVVNVFSVGLFAYKGLWATVGLYAVFTIMAILGWLAWQKKLGQPLRSTSAPGL